MPAIERNKDGMSLNQNSKNLVRLHTFTSNYVNAEESYGAKTYKQIQSINKDFKNYDLERERLKPAIKPKIIFRSFSI